MQLPDQGTHSGSHVCNLRDGCVDATWSPPHVQAFSSSFQPITCFFSGSSKNISARSIMATFCGGRDYLIIRNDLSCSGEVGSTRTLWIWQPTPPFFLGPREHTCFGAYSELKRIWIGEKMYSTVMERTVETSEAGRTEWPSLESRVVPSFRWRVEELASNAAPKISWAIKRLD